MRRRTWAVLGFLIGSAACSAPPRLAATTTSGALFPRTSLDRIPETTVPAATATFPAASSPPPATHTPTASPMAPSATPPPALPTYTQAATPSLPAPAAAALPPPTRTATVPAPPSTSTAVPPATPAVTATPVPTQREERSTSAGATGSQAPEAQATPGSDPAPATPSIASAPQQMLAFMNEQRAAYGLPALAWSPELASAAQAHAEDCAQRNSGSHTGSDGARLRARLQRAGYAAHWVSENWANARSLQQAFTMWWDELPGDDPHRRNILAPQFKEVGIGIAAGGWGAYYVADFGGR